VTAAAPLENTISTPPPLTTLLIGLLIVPGLTVLVGLLMSRGVLNQSPLVILRSEA